MAIDRRTPFVTPLVSGMADNQNSATRGPLGAQDVLDRLPGAHYSMATGASWLPSPDGWATEVTYLLELRGTPARPETSEPCMRRLPHLSVLLLSGLLVAGCDIQAGGNGGFSVDFASGKATDTWSRTYTVPAGGRFELINVNGRITAEATDGKDVVVEATRTAKGRSDEAAKDLLGRLEIREEVGTATVRVESRPPRTSGFGGHEIEWIVKVPTGLTVDLRTVNGGVRLDGLSGEIHARTTNGGVKGQNIIPETIEASTVNGGVEIELGAPLDATDSVEISTVNGGVSLGMPAESKATITARAVNGGVRVTDLDVKRDDEDSRESERRRRRLNGTLNGGGAKVNISTTNGGVRLSRIGNTTS